MGKKFDIPSGENRSAKIADIQNKILETQKIMAVTRENIKKYLISINQLEGSDVSAIEIYRWYVIKEKGLYA